MRLTGPTACMLMWRASNGSTSRIEALPQVTLAEIGGAAMGGGL